MDAGVKALYRTLAKRLHPDHSDIEPTVRERRWHELQLAYEQRDLEGLQRIEAVCDMDSGGLSLHLGLARLRDLADYHRSHVEPIRRALRNAKRHPAFGFEKADRKKLRKEAGIELDSTHAMLRREIAVLMREIDGYAIPDPLPEAEYVRYSSGASRYRKAEEKRSDKDIWDSYDAWREEELRRTAAESSSKNGARTSRGRKR